MDQPSALVDPTVLQALHEFRMPDEPDPADEVAQAFVDVMPDRLARLRAAAHRGDSVEVKALAHLVRGSCAAVGAIAMSAIASDLEAAPSAADVSSLVDQLEALFDRTRPLLASTRTP
jgi:HPt (histidine-containing phosphotransfer) domain-containing protein